MQYIGQSDVAVPYPHGNCVSGDRDYVRSCPSLLSQLKTDVRHSAPSNVYKSATGNSTPGNIQPVLAPRNTKQVQNAAYVESQKTRLSHDALYNLMELAYDLDTFVHKVSIHPNLGIICGHTSIIAYCHTALLASPGRHPSLLSYDTTFCCGDFYVSVLLFRMTIFSPAPVVPVLYFIHDTKLTAGHQEFFSVACQLLPNLRKTEIPLVTDQEGGITKAVAEVLPNVKHILGWNHLLQDVKRHVRMHSYDIPNVRDLVRELLLCSTEDEYTTLLKEKSVNWPSDFSTYFMKNVDGVIRAKMGRWNIEQYRAFDPYSGIPTNQSEGFNTVMKVMLTW